MQQESPDTDDIDLDIAVQRLNMPKRRIYDIVNILEGAGVLERNSNASGTTFRWAAPLVHSSEQSQETFEEEEEMLDLWIEDVKDLPEPQAFISGRELAPLVDEDTSLLAVHLPQESIIRTIHMPEQDEEAFAFKLTTPAPMSRNAARANRLQACLLEQDDEELRPIDFSPPDVPVLVAETPTFVPAFYPSGVAAQQDQRRLNPLDMLLRVLPMPPSTTGSEDYEYKEESHEDNVFHRKPLPLKVSDEEDELTRSPLETLLQASAFCE